MISVSDSNILFGRNLRGFLFTKVVYNILNSAGSGKEF